MKQLTIASFFLTILIVLIALFLFGNSINAKIEETIKTNYQTEIETLKSKLNKQSELLNSIINLNEKNDSDNYSNEQITTDKSQEINQAEYEYVKENGGITITKYIGKQTSVTIPQTINQLPVLKIGESAFADTKVKSVALPSTCKEIDWFAFCGCFALKTVYIPSTVDKIGYGTFDSCSKSLTIYCDDDSFAQKYAQSFGISYSNYK